MSTDPSVLIRGEIGSTAGLIRQREARISAMQSVLTGSALFWWIVTVIGQWAFLYYVAGFYGRAIVMGRIEDWNRNHQIFRGYLAGDTAWNFYFGAHVLLAAVIGFGGVLQLVPHLRIRAARFHRWNGRVFLVTALAGAITGMWMTLVRGVGVSGKSPLGLIAINLDAVLIIAFTLLAWKMARARKIEIHRRWALRLFMVTNGVWFLRLELFGWYLLTGGAGLTDELDGPMNIVMDFASYLVPLGVLQLYLYARDQKKVGSGILASTALIASTAYMCIGIFALMMSKLPLLPRL